MTHSRLLLSLALDVEIKAEAYEIAPTEAHRKAYEDAKADYLDYLGVKAE
jgi:hypothetical protein